MLLAVRLKWRRSVVIGRFGSDQSINLSLDSDDDFRSGCRNVSHHYRQQSSSGLHSPERSNYTITCYPRVQTIYCTEFLLTISIQYQADKSGENKVKYQLGDHDYKGGVVGWGRGVVRILQSLMGVIRSIYHIEEPKSSYSYSYPHPPPPGDE